eukprot:EST46602.1 hypothetical protein SS50377_13407 [Spironucleus salmonicida]
MPLTIFQILQSSTGEFLLQEPYQQLSESSQHLLKLPPLPIFPASIMTPNASLSSMKLKFADLLSSGEIKHHWQHSIQKEELIFSRFESIESTGCEHFPTNLLLQCNCGVTTFCRYCHDELDDSCEKFTFKKAFCASCEMETDIQSEFCTKCSQPLAKFLCKICGVSSNSTPFSHCKICGCTTFPEPFHCNICNRCHGSLLHDCTPLLTDPCPICFANYDNLLFRPQTLTCGHVLHQSCVEKMSHNGPFECPLDKKQVGSYISCKADWIKFISIYAMTEIPLYQIGNYYIIQCSVGCPEFVANWHSKGYICPHCLGVNCSQKSEYLDQDAQEVITNQYLLIKKKHNRSPIYPLILSPRSDNLEMDEVIQDYVERYRQFWESHIPKLINPQGPVPLREFVLAYCLTRVFDEKVGFAAINLMHARQEFPENVRDLDKISVEAIVEVRELRRLKLE